MKKTYMHEINVFYDINKFPNQEGMLVFGISMSKISSSQNAKENFKYIQDLIQKIFFPRVGLTFLYADSLYMNSNESAIKLKNKYQSLCASHKFEFVKILKKNPKYIANSFSYITWSQMLLESKEFFHYSGKLKQIYDKDKEFQRHVEEDIKAMGKKAAANNISFILEEILALYLIAKGNIKFYNNYILGHEKWTLNCYPGKPLASEIYLFQKNFFKLSNPTNIYENSFYDLAEKKLYQYNYLDLKTFKNNQKNETFS